MLVYGGSGVGKTFFACSFPNPLFLMFGGREGGDQTLSKFKNIDVVDIRDGKLIDEVLAELEANKKWDTIVIDNLTFHVIQCIGHVTKPTNLFTSTSAIDMDIQRWGKIAGYFEHYFKPKLHALNTHVVYIALDKTSYRQKHPKSIEQVAYKTEPDISPSSAKDFICGSVDLVAYMHRPKDVVNGKIVYTPKLYLKPELDGIDIKVRSICDEAEMAPSFENVVKYLPWVDEYPVTNKDRG